MRSKAIFFLSFFIALIAGSQAWAAACCGGGVSLPALIQGDERAQFAAQILRQDLLVDYVDPNGYWKNTGVPTSVSTLRVEGAWLLSDRAQMGVVVPVISRTRLNERHAGLGDVAGSLGYEFLPDWDYNPYRPKGVAYLQVVLPTGLGRAESERGGLDSRGHGFWALGTGAVLTKSWGAWDALLAGEVHRGFEKTSGVRRLVPGWGGQLQTGAGFNTRQFRYGALATWTHEDPVRLESTGLSLPGGRERYATANLSVSYLPSTDWGFTLSYVNQTWLGLPENTSLASGVGLHMQRRWAR